MTPKQEDKSTLEVIIDRIYIPPMYYHTTEAKEVEAEIKLKADGFKTWANKLIDERLG